MADTSARRFTLADAMILIAVTGIGIAVVRPQLPTALEVHNALQTPGATGPGRPILLFLPLAFPPLMAWTIGVALCRWRRPRPRFRRLMCQPGFVACLGAILFSVILAMPHLAALLYRFCALSSPMPETSQIAGLFAQGLVLVGPIIATSLVILALSGRWRSERSWIDHAGEALGGIWIALYVVEMFFVWLDR